MRIAQVAPLFESVPPKLYGGTERVVSYLTEELVQMGHDVTLFASGDSVTKARLISPCARSMRLNPNCLDRLSPHVLMLEWLTRYDNDFDVIHSHIDYLPLPLFRRMKAPSLTTLHGRLDFPELVPLFQEFSELPMVSISESQRQPLPDANWGGTIYHGLPAGLLPFHPDGGSDLVFLGRLSAEKRADRAIDIARRSGQRIRIAAKVDPQDQEYFETVAKPLMNESCVQFVGEITDAQKGDFLGGARALIFPIDWPEPFGLVMVEAMACGTPVIAFDCGSVREVIEDGVTGFVVRSVEEAAAAVARVPELSRARIRQEFERRFTARRMAEDYVALYQRLISERSDPAILRVPSAPLHPLSETAL